MDVKDKSLPPERFYKRLSSVTLRNKPIPTPPLPREESKPQKPVVKLVPAVEKKKRRDRKFAWKSELRSAGILGLVTLVIGLLWVGIYNFDHRLATPKPSPTIQATSTYELPTETPEPPIATSTATFMPRIPNLGIGSTLVSDTDGMTLQYVPAGNFTMGSDNGYPNEKPAHTVYLDAFWMDRTDVTNAMYAKCVSSGACNQPTNLSSQTHSSYYANSQFDNYPVLYVTWDMANTYCQWAGRGLPTEAQWEKAARGTDGRTYPWGNAAPSNDLLNYNSAVGDTTEVGTYSKGASPYGVLDMAGNVWQWVADWYSDTYYASSPASNPLGPDSGQFRVMRGGSWEYFNDDNYVRSAFRLRLSPSLTYYYSGFRCSRSQ